MKGLELKYVQNIYKTRVIIKLLFVADKMPTERSVNRENKLNEALCICMKGENGWYKGVISTLLSIFA